MIDIGIFTLTGMNTQLAKAYALLCIDAVKTLNITFDALFENYRSHDAQFRFDTYPSHPLQ